jgi:hypothetical protein
MQRNICDPSYNHSSTNQSLKRLRFLISEHLYADSEARYSLSSGGNGDLEVLFKIEQSFLHRVSWAGRYH